MTQDKSAGVQKESAYSPAETQMIMCMTRKRECTPERCLQCGWLRDEVKERLNNNQAEYIKALEADNDN